MKKTVKKGAMAVAVMFAASLMAAGVARADIQLNAGVGLVLMDPLFTEIQETAQADPLGEIVTDQASLETKSEETASAAAEQDSADAAALLADESVSADSTGETEVDASAVAGDGEASEEAENADSAEAVQLSIGAANVVTDSAPLTEEEMAEEFEEEEASGKDFGYTHLGIVRVDDHLNVRASAEEGSKIVGKMENEAGCEILDVVGNMAHITSGSVEGYVNVEYLLTGPEAVEYASTVVKELATVNCDGLKLREDKSTDAPVYSMVAYGEQLEIFEKDDSWVGVKYDGKKLYVSAEYVTVGVQLKTALNMTEFLYGAGVSDVRMDLCEYAKQFVGNPYVWGGESLTNGCDCSGYVLSIYKKYGITLPHSSRAQVNCGTRISLAEAKPGDLVFYAKGKRINHVGIYIGGGQIVNASSPKTGIRIANVYYRTPVAVTRILQD
ncbi:MAG: C40 family peptidase [Lachnospiraceae bacterium]|nr:C40 family peptidase [Lachnospiraceae bacterium]